MKTVKFLLLISTFSMLTQSCYKRETWGVKGKGDSVYETRDIGGFSRINLSCSADVTYVQDSLTSVVVNAQPNIIKLIKTEVSGEELIIDFDKNVWDSKPVKIVVHSPKMKGMTVNGSGNISSQSSIKTDRIELSVSGSGNISMFALDASDVTAKISGSGNVEILGGKVATSYYVVSGSGNINSEYMQANSGTISVSGSGNIRLYVTENLNVTISGSGDVSYKGTPAVNANVSGSGKLRHI